MTRKMLINAQRAEEVRVAIVTDGVLDKYEVSASESGLSRGNIYRGIVANIQPSLDAAFVDIGLERDGLLRAEDVVRAAAHHTQEGRRPRIDRLLEKGRPVVVQVVRDGIGQKGPLLTTNLSIAGRCLVLMPHDEVRGVSRKVEDEKTRDGIREKLEQLELPEGQGAIVRTNAIDQPKTALNRDLNALQRVWKKVRSEAATGKGPKLLYSDQDLILQVLRDSLDSSIQEVLVDDDEAFGKAEAYMRTFMPRAKTKLTRYTDRMPLFSRFQLESQIDSIYQQRVDLPSGGSVIIQRTEALTSIDVNSGRATRGGSQEETAHATNIEAATEVARQLRLRDIGGLVVVDLIDMRSTKHRREVERVLRDAMKDDKARFTVGRISPNGLIEINRQRLKKELTLRTHRSCPTCSGTGTIASPELVGLNLLRRIETRAVTGRLKSVRVELHPELADEIQNERRDAIAALENEFGIRVQVIAAAGLHRSEEHIEWHQREDGDAAPAAVAAVTVADLADGAAGPLATENDKPAKARKRRRGSRKRRKTTSQASAQDQVPETSKTDDEKGTPDGDPTESPLPGNDTASPGNDKDRPKKRRPRRRRRKKTPSGSGAESKEPS